MHDGEAEARRFLEAHGWTLGDNPGVRRLLRASGAVVRRIEPSALRGAEGEAITNHDRPWIFTSNRLSPTRNAFVALHELGHVCFGVNKHGAPDLEAACDAFAAALLCPRMAYRAAVCRRGLDWEQLAIDFGASCSVVALRYGEVMGEPLALVAPKTVRVRGAEWTWPDERGLRRLARHGGPGIARAVLADDARRVVLVAGETA